MKLTFQTYLLVSLVTLAHVILLAAVLPSRLKLDITGSPTGFLVDEEGIVWLGPSNLDEASVPTSPPAREPEGPPQEEPGAGIEASVNAFTAESVALSATSVGEGSASRRPSGEGPLDPLAISESSDATHDAPPPIEMEARSRPGSQRPLRPLLPSSVN